MRQRDYTTQTKTDYVYKNSTQPTYFFKEAVFSYSKSRYPCPAFI